MKNRFSIFRFPFIIYQPAPISKSRNFKFSGKWQIANGKLAKKGFTLIELIVVITIIAILVAAISISWIKAQEKSRDGRRKSDLKAVQQALDTYFETTNSFPEATGDGKIKCSEQVVSGPSSYYQDSTIDWGTNFTCARTGSSETDTFFQTFPKDPVYQDSTSGYYYTVDLDGKSYTLSASIENSKDPDIAPQSTPPCTSIPSGKNYCIVNQ